MTKAFDVVAWMYENGRTGYAQEISDLESLISEYKGEAGPTWYQCDYTMAQIKSIETGIETVRREAQDRYDDWVSDIYS